MLKLLTHTNSETLNEQHNELVELTTRLLTQLNQGASLDIVYSYLDEIFMKLLEHFCYKKNSFGVAQYNQYFNDHQKTIVKLSKLYLKSLDGPVVRKELLDLIKGFLINTSQTLELTTMNEEDFLLNSHTLHQSMGGVIVVTYEQGHFIKLFGEINETIMNNLLIQLKELREGTDTLDVNWGEIIDIRSWDYLTHSSFELAKSNAKTESRAFSLYIIDDSKANEYLVHHYTKEQECETHLVKSVHDVLQFLSTGDHHYGELLRIDYVSS